MADVQGDSKMEERENTKNIENMEQFVDNFQRYLSKTVATVFNGLETEIYETMEKNDAQRILFQFVTKEHQTLIIQKKAIAAEETRDSKDPFTTSKGVYTLYNKFTEELTGAGEDAEIASLVIVKKAARALSEEVPLSSQVVCSTLSNGDPYEMMLPVVKNVFSPISAMKARLDEESKTERSGRTVEDCVRDLELRLLESQDDTQVPYVELEPVSAIQNFYTNKAATIQFGDPGFDWSSMNWPKELLSNEMTKQVDKRMSKWCHQIRNVANKTRDLGHGSVKQEIAFWKSKKETLNHCNSEIKKPVVKMSLELLSAAGNHYYRSKWSKWNESVEILKNSEKEVNDHNNVLSKFPIEELHKARFLELIPKATQTIFKKIAGIRTNRYRYYQKDRIDDLIGAVIRDIRAHIADVLNKDNDLMLISYKNFEERTKGASIMFDNILKIISQPSMDYRPQSRTIKLPYSHPFINIQKKKEVKLQRMKIRVEEIINLRANHHQLQEMLENTFAGDEVIVAKTTKKVDKAYVPYRSTNVISCTDETWTMLKKNYDNSIEDVESEIKKKIVDALSAARAQQREKENGGDRRDMIRVCARFNKNKLFDRPGIRAAVWEYQEELIENVLEEVQQLKRRMSKQYKDKSKKEELSKLRGIPMVSADVIFQKQIMRQVDKLSDRVEQILGGQWKHHINGKKLNSKIERLREDLNPEQLVEDWMDKARYINIDTVSPIFKVESSEVNTTLSVNHASRYISFLNEVRVLQRCKFKFPGELKLIKSTVSTRYRHAVSLKEAVMTFTRTCSELRKIDKLAKKNADRNEAGLESQIYKLIDSKKKDVQYHLTMGAGFCWGTLDRYFDKFVKDLSKATTEFQDKTYKAVQLTSDVQKLIKELSSCELKKEAMEETMSEIQKIVEEIDEGRFSAVKVWVRELNLVIENVLLKRVEELIDGWSQSLDVDWGTEVEVNDDEKEEDTYQFYRPDQPIIHTIRSSDRKLELQPPIATARMKLLEMLQNWLSVICELPRPHCGLPARSFRKEEVDEESGNFRSVLNRTDPKKIMVCYSKIETLVFNSRKYVSEWLGYQVLWDMEMEAVFDDLGDNIGRWCQILQEMKTAQSMFDNTKSQKSFGPIVIHYLHVQKKVNEKFSLFRKNTFLQLRQRLHELTKNFIADAQNGRIQLEETSFQVTTIKDIVNAVNDVKILKNKSADWDDRVMAYSRAEKLIKNQSYSLPTDWITAERLQSEVEQFQQILTVKWQKLKDNAEIIYNSLEDEFRRIENDVSGLMSRWHMAEASWDSWACCWNEDETVAFFKDETNGVSKIQGNFRAQRADGQMLYRLYKMDREKATKILKGTTFGLRGEECAALFKALDNQLWTHIDIEKALAGFENGVRDQEKEFEQIHTAKEAMAVVIDIAPREEEETIRRHLNSIRQELNLLKEVHGVLGEKWRLLDKMKKSLFKDINPEENRKELNAIMASLEKLSPKITHKPAYHKFIDVIKEKLQVNKWFNSLGNNPSLRPKHYRKILSIIGLEGQRRKDGKLPKWNNITVEELWDADLKKFTKELTEVLATAHGEWTLEKLFEEITIEWMDSKFVLVDFRQICYLVKNFNDLMEMASERLADIEAARSSNYFQSFETEALKWEEKLEHATNLFDVFLEVQKQWVYLQGVFTNSEDVQASLAYHWEKFRILNRKFKNILKDIKNDDRVDVWVGHEKGLLDKMEDFKETLELIKKALNEFLEEQRAQFARFYFVGDDDLLDIIANAKEPIQMNKHLSKMFAGINQFVLDEKDDNIITGFVSREGEVMMLVEPVVVGENAKIQEWLTQIEMEMRNTMATLLNNWIEAEVSSNDTEKYLQWIQKNPAQIALLATQVAWAKVVEDNLNIIEKGDAKRGFEAQNACLTNINETLALLTDQVLKNVPADLRKKYEQLITELVYQKNTTAMLINRQVSSPTEFIWLYRLRFYYNSAQPDVIKRLEIRISRASFYYGFEYLGVAEKLVQTPLSDKAYLTLCEALHSRLGGNPFGPAGTGKTESVKALGAVLGRFVLVFNCDENFDEKAMGRIFIGLCQCGAWGCFDEFNRLEERTLSAVSQQILTIQTGLRSNSAVIDLQNRKVNLNSDMGIFVTMNPGYAGRSDLPDNLKQLFRGIAMIKPNRTLIAEVMLFSQGFRTAQLLSGKIVLLFELCKDQLSNQSHYDFGLRALKSVLRSAGALKRQEQRLMIMEAPEEKRAQVEKEGMSAQREEEVLISSLLSTVVPKLVLDDKELFDSLLESAFPGSNVQGIKEAELRKAIKEVAEKYYYVVEDQWLTKILEFHTIQNITHGVMLVGPSGGGKSSGRNVLAAAMEKLDGIKTVQHVIDPKAISKDQLYGVLDPTTKEWSDGIFTHILRSIIESLRGEKNQRHWLVFDGDVDPEWAENLNSVLDDNKMLTLPNGERLSLTSNIRVLFETPHLKYATPATVSRCGMVWFSHSTISLQMLFANQLDLLQHTALEVPMEAGRKYKNWQKVHSDVVEIFRPIFEDMSGLICQALDFVSTKFHIMKFTRVRAVWSLFSLLRGGLVNILEYNREYDFALTVDQCQKYMKKYLIFALLWGFAGPMSLKAREEYGERLYEIVQYSGTGIELPPQDRPMLDYEIRIDDQSWHPWNRRVGKVEIESHKVVDPKVVIKTVDTVRHEEVVRSWLQDEKMVILCGPPGSGKSMTLSAVLRANQQMYEMVTLNFSSTATPEMVFSIFDQYCKVERKGKDYFLRPLFKNKYLVLFCDECNLPEEDEYGTQCIITFLRQLVTRGGYYDDDHHFVQLQRIQFVGACNPPTDPGRVVLNPRFLNHCPLILVDFPGKESLTQIFGTFVRGLLKLLPEVRNLGENLTRAMIEVYSRSSEKFNTDQQPHYVYSPRELSRWVRGMYRAISENQIFFSAPEMVVRLWAHEALRLFADRLVTEQEQRYTNELVDEIAKDCFGGMDLDTALKRPILFSNWFTQTYQGVDEEELRIHVKQRMGVFRNEVLDVQLVIFDEVLDHVLRIDRVLRQPLGHLLLVGASGAGKTVLSKFVAWMNGMKTFQIKVHRNYTPEDFDIDLREVLKRAGAKQEKICFIFDEGNILDTAFLERMNALLASGEVPGLFEEQEYQQLMKEMRDLVKRDRLIETSEEELYSTFCKHVQNNLHIVFTMNPAGGDFSGRASTSPALFNRCVINWFGTWPETAMFQVAREFLATEDLDVVARDSAGDEEGPNSIFTTVPKTIVKIYQVVEKVMGFLAKNMANATYITPRHYLDIIRHFKKLFSEKRESLEEQQRHLNSGLSTLKETEDQVAQKSRELDEKNKILEVQEKQAENSLVQMVQSREQANAQKEKASILKAELEIELKEISETSGRVEGELASVEPMLQAAKSAVSGIDRKMLTEIKGYAAPPVLVNMTLVAVYCLLDRKSKKYGKNFSLDWKKLKAMVTGRNFIKDVLNLKSDDITPHAANYLTNNILNNPKFEPAAVNRVSKACGPLCSWVTSQVNYSKLLNAVEPMRNQVRDLEAKANMKSKMLEEKEKEIEKLVEREQQLKQDYTMLITKKTQIAEEIQTVKISVDRATKLIRDLSSEKERWEESSNGFKQQLSTLVGDCILSASFLTFIGYYNQTYREIVMNSVKDVLQKFEIQYQDSLNVVQYLASPSDQQLWKKSGLPEDDLCLENAIILERFNRYPLVVDPSGQATRFLLDYYKQKKIVPASFLDDSFLKKLQSALKFGNILLIEEVESMDPILNPVLNQEFEKIAAGQVIRLGDQTLDFNPQFKMFLVTRDPTMNFPPDLCSRVTFVNFSVTPSSLEAQCKNKILKVEAPEIERKRMEQLQLQGEYKVKLRKFEDELLDSLTKASGGNILENLDILNTLEVVKKNAAQMQKKADETEEVLMEIQETSEQFTPFSKACSKIYFSLETMPQLHFLYQFSLNHFLDIVNFILTTRDHPELSGVAAGEKTKRLVGLIKALHRVVFERSKRSLLAKDAIVLATRLAQIYRECLPGLERFDPNHMSFFMKGKQQDVRLARGSSNRLSTIDMKTSGDFESKISEETLTSLELTTTASEFLQNLLALSGFEELGPHIENNISAWKEYVLGPPNALIPPWREIDDDEKEGKSADDILIDMCVMRVLRPDQVLTAASILFEKIFGLNYSTLLNTNTDMMDIVGDHVNCDTPMLLCSTPGNDPSALVEELAAKKFSGKKGAFQGMAMGSPEAFREANRAISTAAKKGSWVLLKNVHLAPGWLSEMEKIIHRLDKHRGFRLFLTAEIHPKIPVTLLQRSSILIFEPPLGIKASLTRTFTGISAGRVNKKPAERSRLYLLLGWLHAVTLERLRYEPIGWSKQFEFSETDLQCGLDAIDEWIERVGKGKNNIDPASIPWEAIHTMMNQYVYGGRIDNAFDIGRLNSFIESLFSNESFAQGFSPSLSCLKLSQEDGKTEEQDPRVGRLGYITPVINGVKLPRPVQCRITHKSGDTIKVRYLEKFLFHEGQRFSLNVVDNWVKVSDFNPEPSGFYMQKSVILPEKTKYNDIRAWISSLDEKEVSNPEILGLPPRAELVIRARRAEDLMMQIVMMQDVSSNDSLNELKDILAIFLDESGTADEDIAGIPKWMRRTAADLRQARENDVLDDLRALRQDAQSIRNPLYRFLSREFSVGARTLKLVQTHIEDLQSVVKGDLKCSNLLRSLFVALEKEIIPKQWKNYPVKSIPVSLWFKDLKTRLEQLNQIVEIDYVNNPLNMKLWLGGMFSPEGFLAATRQYVSSKKQWPLEKLQLQVEIGQEDTQDNAFIFTGLSLYGADWKPEDNTSVLLLTDKTVVALPPTKFTWRLDEEIAAEVAEQVKLAQVKIPVYLNSTFKQLLTSVNLYVYAAIPKEIWTQRSVSIGTWSG